MADGSAETPMWSAVNMKECAPRSPQQHSAELMAVAVELVCPPSVDAEAVAETLTRMARELWMRRPDRVRP